MFQTSGASDSTGAAAEGLNLSYYVGETLFIAI